MPDDKENICGGCKFNGFKGLVQHCRHPEILRPIKGPLAAEVAAGGCRRFVDFEKKVMPGWPQPWPDPVSFGGQ